MNNSFSRETKNKLCEIKTKSVCCRRALLCGILIYRQPQENTEITQLTEKLKAEFIDTQYDIYLSERKDLFKCDNCPRTFLRGVFLSCGMITDPSKLYQLELTMPDDGSAEDMTQLLEECGFLPKITKRRGLNIIYLKDHEAVSDFLILIGAQNASFELINNKIRKEFRNNANRQTNCDAANITRTVSAAHYQIEAINDLKRRGAYESLSSELLETAKLRIENADATLSELAHLHHLPITKSGVNHRLKKIVNLRNELTDKEQTKNNKLN
ncbi:MAG: DNA-binding protein WhiA [Eubacteriales bacterium]|nr:DNA-binding protein WhiA [Eubacteriales bacterium]